MKSKILVLGAVFTLMLAGCAKDTTVKAESVSLDKTTANMVVGDHLQLNATVMPENATNKNVTWSASGDAVTVENGYVSAVKAGESTVTVTTVDGKKTATCAITVNNPVVHVTGVSLDKSTATMVVGDDLTLVATVAPEKATDKSVTWSVTGDAVTVNNGVVHAAQAGEATVTVTTTDGSKTASCAITVNNPVVHVTGVSLNKSSATMIAGKDLTLVATVEPENADDKSVAWSVTGDAVTVNNGVVHAEKAGEATVTATTTDGSKTASCAITVVASSDGVTMTVLGSLKLAAAAATAYGKEDIPVLITLSGDDAAHVIVEVDGSKLNTEYYIYDKTNGSLIIATSGNIGNSTFSVGTIKGTVNRSAAADTIEGISVDGSIKDYISNNNSIVCSAAWSDRCDYASDSASQQVWQRRYMSGSWQYNSGSGQWTTSNSTYHMEEAHSMGLRIANNSYVKTSFLLKKDINEGSGVKARGVSVWLYNPNGDIYKAFNIFAYKSASTTSGDHVTPSSSYIQPLAKTSIGGEGWVNYRVGFQQETTIYNFSLYFETNNADTTYVYLGHICFF